MVAYFCCKFNCVDPPQRPTQSRRKVRVSRRKVRAKVAATTKAIAMAKEIAMDKAIAMPKPIVHSRARSDVCEQKIPKLAIVL